MAGCIGETRAESAEQIRGRAALQRVVQTGKVGVGASLGTGKGTNCQQSYLSIHLGIAATPSTKAQRAMASRAFLTDGSSWILTVGFSWLVGAILAGDSEPQVTA